MTSPLLPRIANAWTWVALIALVILGFFYVSVVFLVTAPFDPGRYAAGRAFRQIGIVATWLNPLWSFHTSGTMPRNPRHPYVVVANHESYADIFLISHLPWEMKWLSKDTIFRIPVMGWMMRMAGDIPIRRGNRASASEALDACRDRLRKRVSVMIFPEGTRSRSDEMLPFKDGAFRLAIETGLPILPIVVAGTRRAMAKGTFRFQRAWAMARVLAPVDTSGYGAGDVAILRDHVRAIISEARQTLLAEVRQPLAQPVLDD